MASSGSSIVGGGGGGHEAVRARPSERAAAVRKRKRVVVSCIECHRRKQKCDRELPCANCRARSKASSCRYEPGAPTARHQDELRTAGPAGRGDGPDRRNDEPLSSTAATWGYGQTGGPSTIAFLKTIEAADADAGDVCTPEPKPHGFAVREKYKGLARQLPAPSYATKLIGMFLAEFNWQYDFVQPDVFLRQLDEWNRLPAGLLSSQGPEGLSPDLRAFPAALFQVMAMALLLVSDGQSSGLSGVKYAEGTTFEELACEYSEAGASIVTLLGKKSLSLTTVQAEFLRASFLKFTASVAESWHMISIAIRDAQELGMHRDGLDPKPQDASLEANLENQWLIQRRRQLYMMLAVWDINMSIILGRPGTVDRRQRMPSIPVDYLPCPDGSLGPIVPRRDSQDPPTPVTRALWLQALSEPLREMLNLDHDGPGPNDFSRVGQLHQRILELDDKKPASFRVKDPDRRWDSSPDTCWVPQTRLYFAQLHEFSLMALHRPYVFHRRESRVAAMRASLELLELQRVIFEEAPPEAWRSFVLFFGSFDAIVLISSVLILFPLEQPELRDKCTEKVYWAIERLAAIQERNPLAKSAQGVLRAILTKLTRAVGSQARAPAGVTSTNSSSNDGDDPWGVFSHGTGPESSDWGVPPAEMLAAMAPVFPTSDLIYHDLTAMQDVGEAGPTTAAPTTTFGWQFGGDLGEDTVWQMLNQFQPRGTADGGAADGGVADDGGAEGIATIGGEAAPGRQGFAW
ncbi:fungal specific transcription factor [Hirsutella rhossiliensis]|uniref:Fungal specific transcription factor domain-containing protein n=1 Tax=Hirsutella rhossiliensis TaxID=111463 RepID=A0A9P8N539_9HYPO|nr:fungal specific transcription factor domain-containing protein [Hirsutella rhossiliensis]KAH0967095.1 fungal specific transcription factor domain-containing protein [Hirsutella rhossiliensis]